MEEVNKGKELVLVIFYYLSYFPENFCGSFL